MLGILGRRGGIATGLFIVGVLLPLPASCGGGDESSKSKGTPPDAASDSSVDAKDGAQPNKDSAAESASDSASDSPVESAAESGPPIDAQDAAYTIELGGQVDQSLTSQHPGNSAVSYQMLSQPTLGEILHFDPANGRFVYTSIVEGEDSFKFAILEDGQEKDQATIKLTTVPLDFIGDWHLDPSGSSCTDYDFKVTQTDAGTLQISPLLSACVKKAAGVTLYGAGTVTYKQEPQALGANGCVNDIANLNYCYAFRFWRISSRGDFQSVETVGGSATIGGQQYLISGVVPGLVRRAGDTVPRSAVASQNTNMLQLGTSDGTPKVQTLTLQNKGTLPANLGNLAMPKQVTMEGPFPGVGGTCGATLAPGATCTVKFNVTPTPPVTGTSETAPLTLYTSDDAGYDLVRLTIAWTWQTPADT